MTQPLREDLSRALRGRIRGEVRTDRASRALYASDASIYRIEPLGVAFPADEDDLRAIVRFAAETRTPLLPRGAGTSLAGQAVGAALVVDCSRHLRGISIDAERRTARVRPGTVLARLNDAAAAHGLQFGPDPASANRCTVGGLIANNGTGAHSILYRMTSDHVRSLRVLLADGAERVLDGTEADPRFAEIRRLAEAHAGEIRARFPRTWRCATGYDLPGLLDGGAMTRLFAGSEGTLGVVLEAEVGLVERPRATSLGVVSFDSLDAAMEAVAPILETAPSAVELVDAFLLGLTRAVPAFAARLGALGVSASSATPPPAALLLVEHFVEDAREGAAALDRLEARLRRAGHRGEVLRRLDPALQAEAWEIRREGLGLITSRRGDAKPLPFVEDCAVPVNRLAEYVRGLGAILREAGTETAVYAHASAGCLHVRPVIDLKRPEGRARMAAISDAVADLVLSLGGAMSGEHGDGLAKGRYMERAFGAEVLGLFRRVKAILDPAGIMNPGKIFDTPDFREDLRFAATDDPPGLFLDWSRDGGLVRAVEMCNGDAACRKAEGVMCPSYRATGEEADSTRGRAALLLAALQGRWGDAEWAADEAAGSLDLCLGCKGCLRECPTGVDVAKMKVEYLHRRRATHGLPLADRLFGRIDLLLRLASAAPAVANLLRPAMRPLLGLAPGRTLPAVAPERLTAALAREGRLDDGGRVGRRRGGAEARGDEVLLFVDTYSEHVDPAPARAAIRLLEAAGFRVRAERPGCCGRPAFSKGLLPEARARARRVVAGLAGESPVVVLEPSCLSMFLQDYRDLLPGDARVDSLAARAVPVETFILRRPERFAPILTTPITRPADAAPAADALLVHAHCHQRACGLAGDTVEALRLAGLEARLADSGCCGMAGAFGFEARHDAVARAVFEDRLGPALRAAAAAGAVAPGVSCREQIRHIAGRAARHPAEVLADRLAASDTLPA